MHTYSMNIVAIKYEKEEYNKVNVINLQSWLTSAARCAWPLGCGMDLCMDEKVSSHTLIQHVRSNSHVPDIACVFMCRYILANSNVEISCHLVDVEMSVYSAGGERGGSVYTVGRESFNHIKWEGGTLPCFYLCD